MKRAIDKATAIANPPTRATFELSITEQNKNKIKINLSLILTF